MSSCGLACEKQDTAPQEGDCVGRVTVPKAVHVLIAGVGEALSFSGKRASADGIKVRTLNRGDCSVLARLATGLLISGCIRERGVGVT